MVNSWQSKASCDGQPDRQLFRHACRTQLIEVLPCRISPLNKSHPALLSTKTPFAAGGVKAPAQHTNA